MTPPPLGLVFGTGLLLLVFAAFGLAVRVTGGVASVGVSIAGAVVDGIRAWASVREPIPERPSSRDGRAAQASRAETPVQHADIDEPIPGDDPVRPQLERVRPISAR